MNRNIIFIVVTALCAGLTGSTQTITGYEYWFDMDYADRTYVSLSGGTVTQVDASASTPELSQGYHLFWFHTQSSDGKWSVPVCSPFVKGNNAITGLEYWYDNDYDTRVYMDLTPGQGGNYSLDLPVSGLTIGDHLISICFVDLGQVRSVPVTSTFFYDGSVSGIEVVSGQPALKLYPNPSRGEVQLSGAAGFTYMVVYDVAGNTVMHQSVSGPDQKLDVSRFAPGLYSLLLIHPSGNKKLTFVKE